MAKGNRGGKRSQANNTSTSRYSQVSPQNLKSGEVIYPNGDTRWTYADNNQGSFNIIHGTPVIIDSIKSTAKTTKVTGYMIFDSGSSSIKSRLVTHTYKNNENVKKVNGETKVSKGAGGYTITLDYAKKIRAVKQNRGD